MSESQQYFNKNGFVVLSNALSKEQCNHFVQHMFSLREQGKLVKDDQCPLSDAVYGDPLFDKLLQKFAKPIGDAIGKTLLPTYTYSRIYYPGEVLKKHKDRPACEFSATLTLGYDAKNVWPIFFDDVKQTPVNLEPGELAVYSGCDIVHWRTAFKGNWHVQVFLHYVDANGPFKDYYKDGRQAFGSQKEANVPNQMVANPQPTREHEIHHLPNIKFPKPIPNSIVIPSKDNYVPGYMVIDNENLPELKFSKQECEKIISLVTDLYPTNASIGGSSDASRVNQTIRSADIYNIEYNDDNKWIHEKIAKLVGVANTLHFDYDIAGITHGLQLIHYKSNQQQPGHYDWHVDCGNGEVALRKISFVCQLTDPFQYEGCELLINNHGTELIGNKQQGSVHLFPSYMLHKVTPITKGERYSLVIWIHGSRRFR